MRHSSLFGIFFGFMLLLTIPVLTKEKHTHYMIEYHVPGTLSTVEIEYCPRDSMMVIDGVKRPIKHYADEWGD